MWNFRLEYNVSLPEYLFMLHDPFVCNPSISSASIIISHQATPSPSISSTAKNNLYAQCHDRVDYIIVILLQCLNSLLSGNACLSHDQLDILVLKTRSINLLSIILVIILLVIALINSLALSVVMGVIMS